jgi:hypothetical protein
MATSFKPWSLAILGHFITPFSVYKGIECKGKRLEENKTLLFLAGHRRKK